MYFASDRAGELGGLALYVTTRTPVMNELGRDVERGHMFRRRARQELAQVERGLPAQRRSERGRSTKRPQIHDLRSRNVLIQSEQVLRIVLPLERE